MLAVRRLGIVRRSLFFSKRNLSDTLTTSSSSNLSNVVRHGLGDAVIILDVGGTKFKTLRSTIASNKVLSDYVQRAEANSELLDNAVFIDRDPTHFGLILHHLRNKVDGLSYNDVGKIVGPESKASNYVATVQLPTDRSKLREIYIESTYYGITELQSNACGMSMLTWLFQKVNKNSNPFDDAAKSLARLKGALIGTSSLFGIYNSDQIVDTLPDGVKAILFPKAKVSNKLLKIEKEANINCPS